MTYHDLLSQLETHAASPVHWMLDDGAFVPAHCHITEVGRVSKEFIDCGGTRRSVAHLALQLWVANDTDHRVDSAKFRQILKLAEAIGAQAELPVEVEYEFIPGRVSSFPLAGVEATPGGLLMLLGTKHTACLAPDQCGVGPNGEACC